MMLPDKKLTHKAPKLESKRLILQPLKITDAKKYAQMGRIHRDKPLNTEAKAKAYLKKELTNKKDGYFLAVIEKMTNKIVGELEFCHMDWYRDTAGELCYAFGKEFWGKGYATEALNLITKYIFEKLGFSRILIYFQKRNIAVTKILGKCGYSEVIKGTLNDGSDTCDENLFVKECNVSKNHQ